MSRPLSGRLNEGLYGGHFLVGEVKDLNPLGVRRLGDDRDAPLDLPAKDYLCRRISHVTFGHHKFEVYS